MPARPDFEALVLPHLDAAYNLARWLLRSDQAAEDAVQEAALRAFRYWPSLRGADARPWLLGIVRNTCFTALERGRKGPEFVEFDEQVFQAEVVAGAHAVQTHRPDADPAEQLQAQRQRVQLDAAIRALAPSLREVIVLRELQELDYGQIAQITGVPIGTVMSRLSRARAKLRAALSTTEPGR